ncbi:hypothetical protein DBR11_21490 [Pedobacter sp. HMWF019]|uniref:RNA polymerase sigma-70 factor n=1 Tax=Pedobacter sp. HMWF019 TaxID=2056856 RepID=UPI000D391059|nr:RNA polymerase sigma-70 factor [Pedobacter sp. HMWF019]PTS95361.1 hypothetical protein DBR11_21490 [Pedobacter sp. HMWF019]
MNYKDTSDEDLVVAVNGDSMEAFEELYDRYWSKLYLAAQKRIHSNEHAEEMVQDFFTHLWFNRKKLVLKKNFSTYAFTAIRYQVLNFIDKENVRRNYMDHLSANVASFDNSTEETVFLHNLHESIEREVNRLPEKCRMVFNLSRNAQKNNKEIADEMDISEKTVEKHLTKAIKRLRVSLNDALFLIVLLLLR